MYLDDESNLSTREGIGKPTWPQSSRTRAAVFKRGESSGYDPKPGDLVAGKVKRGESHVEACSVGVLQYPRVTHD